MNRPARTSLGLAIGCLVALVIAVPAVAGGGCTSAALDEEVWLPDGSRHPAGTLKLCDSRSYNPVTTLHETFVDGKVVGLLRSRRGESEGGDDTRPFMMFFRNERGQLHLYGYAVPAGDRLVTYRIGRQPGSSRRPDRRADGARTTAEATTGAMLLLAATRVD